MAGGSGLSGKRLLVLGAGPAQLGLLEAARDAGVFTIAVDRDPGAPGMALADRRAILSAEDELGIGRLAEAERVEGLIAPGIDWPVGIAARVAARRALPHPLEPATGALAVSKLRQRERFDAEGVPQPRWRLVTEPEDDFPAPCVVKAPDRQGQRGLSLVRDEGGLRRAVEQALEAARNGQAIVEELVEGPELTVNAFSVDGEFVPLTVTDRITAEPPAFGVALAHVWPVEHGAAEAADLARQAVEALGIRQGPTYTQVRLGPEGPKVMEVAARLGGGHDAELCAAALGVDLNGLALRAALGEQVEPPSPEPLVGGAATAFLVAPAGELQTPPGVDEAAASEGVLAVRVYRRPGFRFGELRTGADRAGAVLAVGASSAEAWERARVAAALVRFHTDAALV
ncbi:MAG TPA: ATP-grasp domain-containing protein [Gaiellaceae bacterium]